MKPSDLRVVSAFFSDLQKTQLGVWQFTLQPDVSWLDTVKKQQALARFFEVRPSDMVEVLSRPRKVDAAWFSKHSSRVVGGRTIYAVQGVTVGGAPMALVYTDSFEANSLGMHERFAVADVDGGPKVISRQVRCGECGGNGCGLCKQHGWRHARGRELGAVSPSGEVLRLVAPDHATSKTIYDALR